METKPNTEKPDYQFRRKYERQKLKELESEPKSSFYAISCSWMKQWVYFIKGMEPPGRISHKEILDSKGFPKPGLHFKEHYYVISKSQWDFIHSIYGGDPPIVCASSNIYEVVKPIKVKSETKLTPFKGESSHSRKNSTSTADTSGGLKKVCVLSKNVCGIYNPMYLCFINSTLQSLFCINPFTDYFKNNPKRGTLFTLLKEVILSSETNDIIKPKPFWKYFNKTFPNNRQHDAPEFLRKLIDSLNEELSPSTKTKYSDPWIDYTHNNSKLIVNLFSGLLASKVKCLTCNRKSHSFEPFTLLTLEIKSSLESSFSNFTQTESIKNQYKCDTCKKVTSIEKSYNLVKNPRFLMVQLKRFRSMPFTRKLEGRTKVPKLFDLSPYSNERGRYELISVCVHSGAAYGGHYYSYCKRGSNWYICDDANVRVVDLENVLNDEAYMLFYQKIS